MVGIIEEFAQGSSGTSRWENKEAEQAWVSVWAERTSMGLTSIWVHNDIDH